ncbi:hypothetical protein M422DRAFT_75928 [Sphaerobolus stellatus SS14]|uniref:Transcription factor 25 n=1 Tax=Sphaerobolus stellatus (strain SS14) TaxID=990650 RepID=A0A0C9U6P0_SPHS4|nr:hypothetical protein M422DRAFT_75928 [Sphaerobolus stellatus SS14]
MPPRLSKRQQREKEELEALATPTEVKGEESSSEDEITVSKVAGSSKGPVGFSALMGDNDAEVEEISEEETTTKASKSKKSKKKKKKAGSGAVESTQSTPETTQSKSAKSKSKSRDTKSKGPKTKAEEDEEFEKALTALSGKYSSTSISDTQGRTSATSSVHDTLHNLLAVSLKNLDPEAELRRFFGSRVISSSGASTSAKHSRVKSYFARPQPNWPPAQYRAGLSMRALEQEELNQKSPSDPKERWWTVEVSPRYKDATYEYLQCVMGGDPQFFYNLMYEMPWHADTLLQLAEVYRHREEYSTAADFMSRALFAYERAFTGAFNLTSGHHRLDFDRVENRVFYLAVARNVVDLNRRGTPRTAFEYARLLLSLDPYTDPHGALLHLDYLAIKANQIDWLLGVWDAYTKMGLGKEETGEHRVDPTLLPGWMWSRALALFEQEGESGDHTRSTAVLKEAIFTFPSVAPLLADKLDLTIPSELLQLDSFKLVLDYSPYRDDLASSLIHLMSHIYALRSHSIWKIPARSSWFNQTLASLSPKSFSSTTQSRTLSRLKALYGHPSNITDSLYRHVIVVSPLSADFRRLLAFFPASEKERMEGNIEGDPLPPVTALSIYNDKYLGVSLEGRSGRNAAQRAGERLQRLLGDQGQLQLLLDAHPQLGEMFPGGIAQLGELARQAPHEILEALMAIVGNNNGGGPEQVNPNGERRMPRGEGIFGEHENVQERDHEDDGVDVDEEENDEHTDDDEPSFPVRIVQNLFGRFWGRSADAEEQANPDDGEGAGARPDDVD